MNVGRVLGLPIALATIASAANLLPQRYWVQEQLSNLGAFFLIVHALICVGLLFRSLVPLRSLMLAANAILLAFYSREAAPFFLAPTRSEAVPVHELRFVYINAAGRSCCDVIESAASTKRPDILAIVRAPTGDCPSTGFAHSVGHEGLAILSDHPLSEPVLRELGDGVTTSVLDVEVSVFDRQIALTLFSAPDPHDDLSSYATLLTSRRLASIHRHRNADAILAGDLRANVFSTRYEKLLLVSGMSDARHGSGVVAGRQRTAFLPTEHVLYKGLLPPSRFSGVDAPSGERVGFEVVFGLTGEAESKMSVIPPTSSVAFVSNPSDSARRTNTSRR